MNIKNRGWRLYASFENRIMEILELVIYIVCTLIFTFMLNDSWRKCAMAIFRENYLPFSHGITIVLIIICTGTLLTILRTLYDYCMDLKIIFVLRDNEYLIYLLMRLKNFFFFFHAAFQLFIVEENLVCRLLWNMVFLTFLGVSIFFYEKHLEKQERRGNHSLSAVCADSAGMGKRWEKNIFPAWARTTLIFLKHRYLVPELCFIKISMIAALLFCAFRVRPDPGLFFIMTMALSLFLTLCHDEYYKKFRGSMKLYGLLNVPFYRFFCAEAVSGFLFTGLLPITICGVYSQNINYVMILTIVGILENIFWSIVYINYGCTHTDSVSIKFIFLSLGCLLINMIPILAVFVAVHLVRKIKYMWGREPV